jgi:hypothetical protein
MPQTKVTCLLNLFPIIKYLCDEGFEDLTFKLDGSTQILYAMLQSATIQDGANALHFTRLSAYVSNHGIIPPSVGEWVVPVPLSDEETVGGCSEIHFVSLARDEVARGPRGW